MPKEEIIIKGQQAHLSNGSEQSQTLDVCTFARRISEYTVRGLEDEPIPDNVKWMITCASTTICIVELKPELRWIKWLADDSPAPYGPEATSSDRQLATPYVILKVPFRRGRVTSRVEVFYRNQPLRSLDGEGGALYWPNLLNVSPHSYGCVAWFCTQYLRRTEIPAGLTAALDEVTHHLWGGQFNRSSEAHEGASTFSLCLKQGVDQRVTDVNRWEQESQKNPKFVLSVEWQPTGLTVRDLVDKELKRQRMPSAPGSAAALGNILLRRQKPK